MSNGSKDIRVDGHLVGKTTTRSDGNGGTNVDVSVVHGRDVFGLDRATIDHTVHTDKHGNVNIKTK